MKSKLTNPADFSHHFSPTDKERRLLPLAVEYYARCELYDRTVCTGPVTDSDGVLPANHAQIGLINRNASIIYRELAHKAQCMGYNSQDLNEARRMVAKIPISQILTIYYAQLDEARIAKQNQNQNSPDGQIND